MHGREVQDKARMLGHPLGYLATMMCTDIVTDEMNRLDRFFTLPVQLPVFSANTRPVHVRERGRQSPVGAPVPRGAGGRRGR